MLVEAALPHEEVAQVRHTKGLRGDSEQVVQLGEGDEGRT